MEIKHLLQSQANAVLDAITTAGFSPTEFEWIQVNSPRFGSRNPPILISKIKHGNFYFKFDNYEGAFHAEWSPDNERLIGKTDGGTWPGQLELFRNWLSYLRRETEAPDLWASITNERDILEAGIHSDDNSPFNSPELKQIHDALNEIKEYLVTAHSFDRQIVEPQLKYLAESSTRVGRKDWKNLLLATLVNLAFTAGSNPHATSEIFRFAGSVLQQILHQPLLLP